MANLPGFFAQLRRRNVVRAGMLYVGAVWALSQGIAQLAPFVGLPEWTVRWFLVAAAIGFPFWLAFAWYFAFTAHGLKRESELDQADTIIPRDNRRLNAWIIGVLAVAVVLLATNQFVVRRDATSRARQDSRQAIAEVLASLPEKSLAVLPFANEGGDPAQQYFSDGLSEALITDLTQIVELKVIGKYSSFHFRDSKDSPMQIGAALGVANLVTGSVRQVQGMVRVTVSLIRARDGSSVWSQRYNRSLNDMFAMQDEIGTSVATALKINLVGKPLADPQKPPSGNVEAYELMLQAREQQRRGTKVDWEQAIALLEKAVKLDPGYGYAWAVLSNVRLNLGVYFLGGDARLAAIAQARSDLDRAAAQIPDAAIVHVLRGYTLAQIDGDPDGALKELQRAIAIAPNDGTAINFLAGQLSDMGHVEQAVELMHRAIEIDPLRANLFVDLSRSLIQLAQFDAAEQAARKAVQLQPRNPGYLNHLSSVLAARGKLDDSEKIARQALALDPQDPMNQLQLAAIAHVQGRYDTARQVLRKTLAAQPDYPGAHAALAELEISEGNPAAALREAAKETNPEQKAWVLALAKQAGSDRASADASLADYVARYGQAQPNYLSIADLYAVRKQADEMFDWLRRGVGQRNFLTISNLLADPLLQPWQKDARFVAICKPLGLSIPGEK